MPRATKKDDWVKKDRVYQIIGNDGRDAFPVSYDLRVTSTPKNPLIYREGGENKPIRYCENQTTVFEDEQKGRSLLGRVVFYNGRITVPKDNVVLQKLLSIYHPYKDKKYYEIDPEAKAEQELEQEKNYILLGSSIIELKDFEAKAIGRSVLGNKASSMPVSTIKHNLISKSKADAETANLISDLISDEDLSVIALGYNAIDAGIIKLSDKKDKFLTVKDKRELFTIGFDEDPYEKLKNYLKSKEGEPLRKSLEKLIK